MAEHHHRKREELAQMKSQRSESENNLTCYGAGAVVAIGVQGIIIYYDYQSKTPKETPKGKTKESSVYQPKEAPAHRPKETPNKFDMDYSDINFIQNRPPRTNPRDTT